MMTNNVYVVPDLIIALTPYLLPPVLERRGSANSFNPYGCTKGVLPPLTILTTNLRLITGPKKRTLAVWQN
jgi:hypothetical protein